MQRSYTKKLLGILSLCFTSTIFSHELRVVTELQKRLRSQPAIILFGAPGSGKTEQMELALNGDTYQIFDLRSMFLQYYADSKNITDKKELDNIKKNEYQTLKDAELAWLQKEKDAIIKKLASSKNGIITFDEFDLWGIRPSADELESAKIIIDIAKNLSPKKLIFIVHSGGLHSKELQNHFAQQFKIDPSEIIRTTFLSTDEETAMLRHTSLSDTEKQQFMSWAQGDPSAYLTIIENLSKKEPKTFTHDELTEAAKNTVRKVYKVTQITAPHLAKVIAAIANDTDDLKKYDGQALGQQLAETGLVGLKSGTLVMPRLVREVINLTPSVSSKVTPSIVSTRADAETYSCNYQELNKPQTREEITYSAATNGQMDHIAQCVMHSNAKGWVGKERVVWVETNDGKVFGGEIIKAGNRKGQAFTFDCWLTPAKDCGVLQKAIAANPMDEQKKNSETIAVVKAQETANRVQSAENKSAPAAPKKTIDVIEFKVAQRIRGMTPLEEKAVKNLMALTAKDRVDLENGKISKAQYEDIYQKRQALAYEISRGELDPREVHMYTQMK